MRGSAVVTGCGTGIGRAIFDRLVRDGWFVVGLEKNTELAARLRADVGDAGDVLVGDVTERDDLQRASARAAELVPLGAWINNAAVALGGNLHVPDESEVSAVVNVNLMGYFWGASEAIQAYRRQRSAGAVLNISSIHARSAFSGWAAYDMAKGGVNALTRYIAVEYGPVGIRANAIEPGAIRTALLQKVIDDSADPRRAELDMAALHPLGRIGEPGEIASVASFLVSPEASFVTGQCIAVDGGATARCYPYPPPPGLLDEFGRPTA